MAGWPGAQLCDVNRLGEIHLEQGALAKAQRNRVLRILFRFSGCSFGESLDNPGSVVHRDFVTVQSASRFNFGRNFAAVLARELLFDLNATTMTMHIAKPADVHQNVEPELLTCAESAEHLVMPSA